MDELTYGDLILGRYLTHKRTGVQARINSTGNGLVELFGESLPALYGKGRYVSVEWEELHTNWEA